MAEQPRPGWTLFKTEDYWAVWLGMGILALALGLFSSGGSLAPWAVTPGEWSSLSQLRADLVKSSGPFVVIFLGFGLAFSLSLRLLGRSLREFVPGFAILFAASIGIFYLAGWKLMRDLDLGPPVLSLIVGLVVGNLTKVPQWFQTALRTEYYVKTGIVLLGATLPLTLIRDAGPIAFVQATIVSVVTWLTIFLAATRLFKLDPRFGAVLGTGGAVCGVSGSIAVGGAVKADKDHIAIGIAVVSVWALVMIFVLTLLTKVVVVGPQAQPEKWYQMTPGEAGAWVGTSEFADAAGYAVVAELARVHGDAPIHAFTLMKVIGRDIWIGIWCLVLSVVSVVYWEKGPRDEPRGRLGAWVIWERFPKFVLGFFAASVIMSLVAASQPADHVGKAPVKGTAKTRAQSRPYDADFTAFRAPASLADRFAYDASAKAITFRGKMSLAELEQLSSVATEEQKWALKQLHYKSDWFSRSLHLWPGAILGLHDWSRGEPPAGPGPVDPSLLGLLESPWLRTREPPRSAVLAAGFSLAVGAAGTSSTTPESSRPSFPGSSSWARAKAIRAGLRASAGSTNGC
ncbi:MAG: putative sulfate exporter family transporter [Candidatus Riflebacteria bacterium]|nr:putative sulfate exporter family transporter [Candidatus Riflebacteria bacterium]